LGPPTSGGRYALGLAGLLGPAAAKPPWSGAVRHPAASLGRTTVFFLLVFFFGGWVALSMG